VAELFGIFVDVCTQNEFVGSFKHAARREMSEADVNGSMYVQFEDNSNVISTARIAVGGILSTAATVYDLTQPLTGRSVSSHFYSTQLIFCYVLFVAADRICCEYW